MRDAGIPIEVHTALLRQTFELARHALLSGDRPFGALLAVGSRVVLTARNTVVSANDPIAHAETNLMRRAWSDLPTEIMKRTTLYSSTEPCVMCAGAIIQTMVNHVVYGCQAEHLYQQMGVKPMLGGRSILLARNPPVQVQGPFLEDEALRIHRESRWWLTGCDDKEHKYSSR